MYLKPEDGYKTRCPYRAIKTFDDILIELVGEECMMERFLICPKCALKDGEGYFSEVGPEFEILNRTERCDTMFKQQILSPEKHKIEDTHSSLFKEVQPKTHTLAAFLREGIEYMETKPLSEVRPTLLEGDQVWIYRDRKANCVSCIMPYAHVAIYVGHDEVVHVTKHEEKDKEDEKEEGYERKGQRNDRLRK